MMAQEGDREEREGDNKSPLGHGLVPVASDDRDRAAGPFADVAPEERPLVLLDKEREELLGEGCGFQDVACRRKVRGERHRVGVCPRGDVAHVQLGVHVGPLESQAHVEQVLHGLPWWSEPVEAETSQGSGIGEGTAGQTREGAVAAEAGDGGHSPWMSTTSQGGDGEEESVG